MFNFNNVLHRHSRLNNYLSFLSIFKSAHSIAFNAFTFNVCEKILRVFITDKPNEKFGFRGFRYNTAKIKFTRHGKNHDLLFDSRCTINFMDWNFLFQCISGITLFKMFTKMIIKNVGNQKHDVTEFVMF